MAHSEVKASWFGKGFRSWYPIDLHIFRRGCMTISLYRYEVLRHHYEMYAGADALTFDLMDDNARHYSASSKFVYILVEGYLESEWLRLWSCQYTHLTIIPLKIFRLPSDLLFVLISHFHPFSLSCKLLYNRNGNYLFRFLFKSDLVKHSNMT